MELARQGSGIQGIFYPKTAACGLKSIKVFSNRFSPDGRHVEKPGVISPIIFRSRLWPMTRRDSSRRCGFRSLVAACVPRNLSGPGRYLPDAERPCRKAIAGSFTGRRLADFFGAQREDWEGARAIINGSDRARLGAGHARAFHRALVAARIEPARVR